MHSNGRIVKSKMQRVAKSKMQDILPLLKCRKKNSGIFSRLHRALHSQPQSEKRCDSLLVLLVLFLVCVFAAALSCALR